MLIATQLFHNPLQENLSQARKVLLQDNLSWQCIVHVNALAERRESKERISLQLLSCISERQEKYDPELSNVYAYGTKLQQYFPGDQLVVQLRFFLPHQYRNLVNFDQENYLLTEKMLAYAMLEQVVSVQPAGFSLQKYFAQLRLRIVQHIDQLEKSDDALLLKAMSVGWKEKWDDDLRNTVAVTGIAHLVAISGFQVTFVAWFLSIALGFFFSFFSKIYLYVPRQKLLAIVVLLPVWAYVMISGAQAATLRAAIMLTVILLGKVICRKDVAVISLLFAALLINLFSPYAFLSVSFQLSFAAMLALIWLHPIFWEKILVRFPKPEQSTVRQKMVFALAEIVSATLATTLLTLPIQAFTFYQVSFFGILINLVAVPFAGFIHTPLVMLGIIGDVLHFPTQQIWYVALLATKVLSHAAQASFPLAELLSLHVAPKAWQVLAFFGLIFAWVYLPRKKVFLLLPSCCVLLMWYWPNVPLGQSKFFSLHVLDVGQGDAMIVQFPGGATWLIDGAGNVGSKMDMGKQVIAPQLWRLGIHRVEKLLVSHPHMDHYDGFFYLSKAFQPQEVWIPPFDAKHESDLWKSFLQALADLHIPVRVMSTQDACQVFHQVKVCVQNPLPSTDVQDINDSSLVASLHHGENDFLLTGDIEKKAEKEMLQRGLRPVEFLKVPHHGSRTSSSENFLQALQPRFAAVSVGEKNFYRLPNQEVLDRLQMVGATVFRSDQDGMVSFVSDGKKLIYRQDFPKK